MISSSKSEIQQSILFDDDNQLVIELILTPPIYMSYLRKDTLEFNAFEFKYQTDKLDSFKLINMHIIITIMI